MVFGLTGVMSIVSGIATGKKMEELQLTEFPNMPFLYWLAVAGALVKPKWTDKRKWPALKVILCSHILLPDTHAARYSQLRKWAGTVAYGSAFMHRKTAGPV